MVFLVRYLFVSLKVLHSYKMNAPAVWNEKLLIENRLGRVMDESEQLCAYHRYSFGVCWYPSKICQHPHHEYQRGRKAAAVRPASSHILLSMSAQYGIIIPIGSMLCQNHLKSERQLSEERTVSEIELPPVPDAPAESLDTDYESEEVQVSEDILDLSMKCAEDITTVLDASPLQFQLKRKLEHIDDNTKQRLARKFKRLQESLETKFSESIAPDKSEHEDDAEEYEMNLHDVATELRMPWKIDDWVAVVYDKQWYPGVIVEVHYYVYIH